MKIKAKALQKIIAYSMLVLLLLINGQTSFAFSQYSDIDRDDWFYSYIERIDDFAKGYPDGSFKPKDNISIAEFLAFVIRANDLEVNELSSNPWYQTYIDIGLDNQLILPNEFSDYNRDITRGEIANILSRLPLFKDEEVAFPNKVRFVDEIPEKYIRDINLMYEKAIISGYEDHTFRPNNHASRSEALVMIIRAIDEKYWAIDNPIPMRVKLNEDNQLQVVMTLQNGKEEIIEFDYVGVNQIYSFSKIQNELNLLEVSSDFIGPYIMSQKDLGNSNGQFTGGWHGSNGDASGNPTASTEKVSFTLDDQYIEVNKWTSGNNLVIKVENNINGNNSKTSLLNEQITYTMTNQLVEVDLKARALENLTIYRYYGLQTQNKIWQTIMYENEMVKNSVYSNTSSSYARKYTLMNEDGYYLEAQLKSSGLGNFKYKEAQLPTCFSLSYGKTYFNLINGIDLELAKNESFDWSGQYFFYKESSE